MPPKQNSEGPVFTFQEVACMVAAMEVKGVTLAGKVYDLMASLDGNKTASGYEHKFRAVKSRGKELAATLKGEAATPKSKKSPNKRTPASSKKRDRTSYCCLSIDHIHLLTSSASYRIRRRNRWRRRRRGAGHGGRS